MPSDAFFEEELQKVGNRLLEQPLASNDELLNLLNQLETYLSTVDRSPSKEICEQNSRFLRALFAGKLLKHSDDDVKVTVASCFSQIMRITTPNAPYNDDQMKVVFQLIVSSFEKLSDKSSRSFDKRTTILETFAKVRSCKMMLDLKCDALIVEMLQHFLNSIRDYHPENVFWSMEAIMTLVFEESDDIFFQLLSTILSTLKKDNQEVMPIARRLVEKVLQNCATRIRPFLIQYMKSLDIPLDDYSIVVSNIYHKTSGNIRKNDLNAIGENLKKGRSSGRGKGKAKANLENFKPNSPVKDSHLKETVCLSKSTKKIHWKKALSRKRTHGKEMACVSEELGANMIGKKIKVWWSNYKVFFEGTVESWDHRTKKHKILYTDGDKERLLLKNERWEFIDESVVEVDKKGPALSSPDNSSELPQKTQNQKVYDMSTIEVKMDGSSKSTSGRIYSNKSKDDILSTKSGTTTNGKSMSETVPSVEGPIPAVISGPAAEPLLPVVEKEKEVLSAEPFPTDIPGPKTITEAYTAEAAQILANMREATSERPSKRQKTNTETDPPPPSDALIVPDMDRLSIKANTKDCMVHIATKYPQTFLNYSPFKSRIMASFSLDTLASYFDLLSSTTFSSVKSSDISDLEEILAEFEGQGADFGWLTQRVSYFKTWHSMDSYKENMERLSASERTLVAEIEEKRAQLRVLEDYLEKVRLGLNDYGKELFSLNNQLPSGLSTDSPFLV